MRKSLHVVISCLFVICCAHTVLGQERNSIVPVTPEAAALAKMVNYPVNLNTGVPGINIPFYTIKIGGMELPITFEYNASGFKINERSTRVGLGWSLSTDLQITRSVNGLDDFKGSTGYLANTLNGTYTPGTASYPLFYTPSPFPNANAYDMAAGLVDGLPDKFNYRLLNKSGSFFFQKTGGISYTIVTAPYENIKITFDNNQFVVVDTDGTTYYFGTTGGGDVDAMNAGGKEVSTTGGTGAITTWKCLKIVNNVGSDEINFSYSPKGSERYVSYGDYIEYYSNDDPCTLDAYLTSNEYPLDGFTSYDQVEGYVPFHRLSSPKYWEYFANGAQEKLHVPYVDPNDNTVYDKVYTRSVSSSGNGSVTIVRGIALTEITFRGGKVVFSGTDKLSSIRVFDQSNNERKSVYLTSTYTTPSNLTLAQSYNGPNFLGTLYLDGLEMKGGGISFEKYGLLYNSKFCFGDHLKGQDAWGYVNGNTIDMSVTTSATSIPRTKIIQPRYYFDINPFAPCNNYTENVSVYIGEDQFTEVSSDELMQRGILQRIIYPTGGFADFDFEANQYNEIYSRPDWSMGLPQLCGGLRIRSISYYDANTVKPKSQSYYRYGDYEEGTGVMMNKPRVVLGEGKFHFDAVSDVQTIAYLKVLNSSLGIPCSDRTCLAMEAIETKTTYRPASARNYSYANGSPIYYTKVTEYKQDMGKQSGKTVYEYYPPETFHDFPEVPLIDKERVSETPFSYIKTSWMEGAQKSVSTYKFSTAGKFELLNKRSFEYIRYLRTGQVQAVYSYFRTLYQLVENGYIGQSRDLYDNTQMFASSLPNPDGEYRSGEYGIPIGKLLLSKETEESFDGPSSQLTTIKNYYYDNNTYPQLSRVVTSNSKQQAITKSIKYAYDFNGVYDQMEALNMISQPVEEVEFNNTLGVELSRKKTNYAAITAGFGFYAPETEQGSINGQPLETDLTINKYDQYGNILQMTGRDGIPVSYLWGYQARYPVAELKGVLYSTIPSIYLSNSQINSPSSDNSLRTVLANLRSAFIGNKLISTYTYKPLAGITSQTTPNSLTTYYDYDLYDRLITVKDNNEQLVKAQAYQSNGPSTQDLTFPLFASYPVMRTHYNVCDNGPLMYNYIVPGGKYVDASKISVDFQAQSDVEAGTGAEVPPCPSGQTDLVPITLFSLYVPEFGVPGRMEIDFLQEGSIVASQSFIFNSVYLTSTPFLYKTFYLPVGTYQVSFRPWADTRYAGAFLDYFLYELNVAPIGGLQTGSTITLEPGKQYQIDVSNIN